MTRLLEARAESEALEHLHATGCTDGLPVVIPTPERVAAMIARVDLDPDLVLGEMGPRNGAASVEKVAAAAVMAGCLPEHFPVVVAAVRAVCRDEFDLTEVNQTTHCLAPLIAVNGPAGIECGPIVSGMGIFGPGNRAGASIGRAMSLALINIAGRNSDTTDLAVFSSPGKFTACIAEAEQHSPFEPYHVSRGFDGDESVATVIAVEAPHSLIMEPSGNARADAERLIRITAGMIASPGGTHAYIAGAGGLVVVLNPEHAQLCARAGMKRQDVVEGIAEHALVPADFADTMYAGLNTAHDDDEQWLCAVRDPQQIMLLVAGGVGSYSAVLPGWGYAPHQGLPVSELIDVNPWCASPTG